VDAPVRHWRFQLGGEASRAVEPGMSGARGVLGTLATGSSGSPADVRARCDDALLVVCELLTNACQHTPGPLYLDLALDHGRLTVAVADPAAAPPQVRSWRPARSHGHGLHLVQRLTDAWGVRPIPGGKIVWATLAAP
jgi:hypothetical protein